MFLPFEIDLSLVEVLLFLILSLLISYFLYFNIRNRLSKFSVVLLTSLRTFFLFFLILLIYNPKIISFQKIDKKPILVIAKDNSKSVKEDINDKLHFLVENLDDFEVFTYSFSEKIIEGFSESNNGLIIVKDNKSQHSHGRRSFSGFNKTVESHLVRGTDDTSSPKKKKKKKNQNSGKNGRTGKQSFKILDMEM